MFDNHDPSITDERWFLVEEGLPDDDIEVLVYLETIDVYCLAYREDGVWFDSDEGVMLGEVGNREYVSQDKVSHWRHLVPPAKKGVKNG